MLTRRHKLGILSCLVETGTSEWQCGVCGNRGNNRFVCPHGCGTMCNPRCACVCMWYDELYDASWSDLVRRIMVDTMDSTERTMTRQRMQSLLSNTMVVLNYTNNNNTISTLRADDGGLPLSVSIALQWLRRYNNVWSILSTMINSDEIRRHDECQLISSH